MTCSVEGCERGKRSGGMCNTHYERARIGSGLKPGKPIEARNPGQVCSVEDCGRPHKGHGFCKRHYVRWVKYGDPSVVKTGGTAQLDDVSYEGAHKRVRRQRGSASTWWCSHCDNRAADWAYDHRDADEQFESHKRTGEPMPYSLDPEHYFPLCRSCHAFMDAAFLRKAAV